MENELNSGRVGFDMMDKKWKYVCNSNTHILIHG